MARPRPDPHTVAAAHLRVLREWTRLVENTGLRYAEGLHREHREAWCRHCLRHLTPTEGTP